MGCLLLEGFLEVLHPDLGWRTNSSLPVQLLPLFRLLSCFSLAQGSEMFPLEIILITVFFFFKSEFSHVFWRALMNNFPFPSQVHLR